MYRHRPRPELTAYAYNMQATEDYEDICDQVEKSKRALRRHNKGANYRPLPLTWPFIACQIVLLCGSIAAIVYLGKAMPNSESTAQIEARHLAWKRNVSTSASVSTSSAPGSITSSTPPSSYAQSSTDAGASSGRIGTTNAASVVTSSPPVTPSTVLLSTTGPPTVIVPSSETTSHFSGTRINDGASATSTAVSSSVSSASSAQRFATTPQTSSAIPDQAASTSSERTTSLFSSHNGGHTTRPSASPRLTTSTSHPPGSRNSNLHGGVAITGVTTYTVETSFMVTSLGSVETTSTEVLLLQTKTVVSTHTTVSPGRVHTTTIVSVETLPTVGAADTESLSDHQYYSTVTSVLETTEPDTTIIATSTFESTYSSSSMTVLTTTASDQVYASYGVATVTSTFTIQAPGDVQSQVPETRTIVNVQDGTTYAFVATQAPQTHILNTVEVLTETYTPPAQTYETELPGSFTTEVLVVTPSPYTTPTLMDLVSTLPATAVTKILTQGFRTYVTTISGVPTTITEASIQTIITTEGGGLTTAEVMSTPSGSYMPITYTGVTTIGGTPTTALFVTTPTGSQPISITVVSTISGRLTTMVITPSVSAFLSTITSQVTSVDSSRGLKTSYSTRPGATSTAYSISTPTPTDAGNDGSIVTTTQTFSLTPIDYFLGTFLPIVIAVALVIPLRIIDQNAKLYQPFHAMTKPDGTSGADSMTLDYNGPKGLITPVITLAQGHPVPFVTTLMVLCASFMAPLATEALGLKVHGHCKITSIEGCAVALGVSPVPAYALVALLSLIVLFLMALLIVLRGWETGVCANPWSMVGIASLAANPDLHVRPVSEQALRKELAQKQFGFGYYEANEGEEHHGIVLLDDTGQALQGRDMNGTMPAEVTNNMPFMALGYIWRIAFILFLAGLLGLILYYHLTLAKPSGFENFMDTHTFGVRFLFAVLGVAVTFCWQAFFISVAVVTPYQAMSLRAQPPERSILVAQPTNAFYGLYSAVQQRHAYMFVTALMALLAEFLPIILSNVPYSLTQTLVAHRVCARLSIALLALMILAVAASFLIRWPRLPVDPRSIAGAMYYVSDSYMLSDFAGMSILEARERKRRVKELGRRYYYGETIGRSGWSRRGVDSDEGLRHDFGTEYRGYRMG